MLESLSPYRHPDWARPCQCGPAMRKLAQPLIQLTLPLYPSDSFIPEWASWIRALRRLASTPCFQTRPVLVFFFFVYLFVSVRPAHRRAKCGGAASWSRRAGSQRRLPSGGTDRRFACAGTAAGRAGQRFAGWRFGGWRFGRWRFGADGRASGRRTRRCERVARFAPFFRIAVRRAAQRVHRG